MELAFWLYQYYLATSSSAAGSSRFEVMINGNQIKNAITMLTIAKTAARQSRPVAMKANNTGGVIQGTAICTGLTHPA